MNAASVFSETFLRDCNQNSLAHILSFLDVGQLGKAACASKRLAQVIHEDNAEYVDLVWQGAECGMTKIHDTYFGKRLTSFANARDHCKRFGLASKYAEHCEEADDLPEDERMGLPQVLTDLFHMKGCDKESVAAMVQQGEMDQTTNEELSSGITIGPARSSTSEIPEGEKARMKQQIEREDNELAEAMKESVPDKEYHHEIFVRMTKVANDEVVFEGFCPFKQNFVWNIALDSHVTRHGFDNAHKLKIQMLQKSAVDMEEMQSLTQSRDLFEHEQTMELQFTVVAIDKRDLRIQCVFHGEQTSWKPNCSYPDRGIRIYEDDLREKNPRGSVQLGPSGFDRYGMVFAAGMCESADGKRVLPPAIFMRIRRDESIMMQAMARSMRERFNAQVQDDENEEGENESDGEDDDME